MRQIPFLIGLIISFFIFFLSGKHFITVKQNWKWMLPRLKGEYAVMQGYFAIGISILILIIFVVKTFELLGL